MRGKSFGTVASPVQRVGAPLGGGPVLIARRWYTVSGSDTVPAGVTRATVRCVGGGGGPATNSFGGGGGAYARDDIACAAGQSITVSVDPISTDATQPYNMNGKPASVQLNGKSVIAAGGFSPSGGGGTGGQAASSTGSVRRSGGSGGSTSGPTNGSAGTGGGAGGVSSASYAGGGGSAGDLIDADSLGLGSPGVTFDPNYTRIANLYGAGGGIINIPGAARPFCGPPVAVIEFWSF